MSYPSKYTRQYDYVAYQNANPNRPLPAGQIHADLNQAAISSAEIVDFLKKSLRSDGAIMNAAVGVDQLAPAVKASIGDAAAIQDILDQIEAVDASATSAATSATNANLSAAAASTSATNAVTSASSAATSATNAAASAAALAASTPSYGTRAVAAATTIPISTTVIQIVRYAAGYPLAPATYIPGTSGGPMALQEAGGHWWELDVSGNELLIPWFGAKGDGSAADTAAVQAAYTLAAAGKKRLDGMKLNYKITSTITGASDVETVDATFAQTTHTAHPMFNFNDKTEWKFRRCRFAGDFATDLDYSSTQYGAIVFGNSGSSDQTGIAVEECIFSGFPDNYYINGAITGSGGILNARFKRNRVLSDLGANYVDQTRIWLSMFATGSSAGTTGRFFDTEIHENYIDGNSLTIPITPWSGHTRISIKNNFILNPGARSLFNSSVGTHNCYAMIGGYDTVGTIGNSTTCGQDGEISGNVIVNPPSAGIYFATALNFNVHDNTIMGQSRTDDATLPRAGISCNDLRKSKVHHNRMIGCWGGVAVVTTTGGSDVVEVADNEIYGNTATDSFGIRIGAPAGTTTSNVIALRRNTIRLTGSASLGVRSLSTSSAKYGSLIIEGNDIVSPSRGIDLGGSYLAGNGTIRGNKYGGVLSVGALIISSVSGLVIVQNETIDLAAATGYGLIADSSTIEVNGMQFNGKTSGSACISAVSAVGTIEGVSFRGCTASLRVAASSLGYSIPTNTGTPGDYVQNLNPDLSGTSVAFGGWYFKTGTSWITGP
ncbi:hypothetical protein [Bradyrhizobium cosmicum]|uniref:hypothetical protein n=1 Tax=Bradyrhizobium cosmicum TaxID=1404864 RepID=UPI0028E2127E|nr:hypothetical protein [Bradyrhizobium cosmicum]